MCCPNLKPLICKPSRYCHCEQESLKFKEIFASSPAYSLSPFQRPHVHTWRTSSANPPLGEGGGSNEIWAVSPLSLEIIQMRTRARTWNEAESRTHHPLCPHHPPNQRLKGKIVARGYPAIIHPPRPCHSCLLEHLNWKFHLPTDSLLKLQRQIWTLHPSFHWFRVCLGYFKGRSYIAIWDDNFITLKCTLKEKCPHVYNGCLRCAHHSHGQGQGQFKRHKQSLSHLLTFQGFFCDSLDLFYSIQANLSRNQGAESSPTQPNLTQSKFLCPYNSGQQ